MEYVLTILSIICTVVAVVISYYQFIKQKIEREAIDAINKAEDLDKIGAEKMKEAVKTVYAVIPAIAKPFVSEVLVETIIQSVFDKVEEYARKQLNK